MGSKSNESSPDPDISEKGNDSILMTTTPSLVNISKINADVERNIGQILIKQRNDSQRVIDFDKNEQVFPSLPRASKKDGKGSRKKTMSNFNILRARNSYAQNDNKKQ